MKMENAVTVNETAISALEILNNEENNAVIESNSYLPRIALVYKTSKAFEDGKAKVGQFFTDAGGEDFAASTINLIPLSYVSKAMEFKEGKISGSLAFPQNVRDPWSTREGQEFLANHDKADTGHEFLCYIPPVSTGETGKVVTFFLKKTNSKIASQFSVNRGKVFTLSSEMKTGKNGSYPAIVIQSMQSASDAGVDLSIDLSASVTTWIESNTRTAPAVSGDREI
jgi:hypothetical protein